MTGGVELTPEDIAKLKTKQLANVIRKLQSGKTLTAREEAILAQAEASGGEAHTSEAKPPGGGYAKTWDELAQAIGIDRRSLTNVRERFAKEINSREGEWHRADGRKEIAWWIRFCEEKDVRGRGVNNPEADYIDERQLRLQERKLRLERERLLLDKERDALLPVAEFEQALATMVSAFRQVGNALPGRATGKILLRARAAVLTMLRASLPWKTYEKIEKIVTTAPIDFADIEEILQAEWDLVVRTLESCEWMGDRGNGGEEEQEQGEREQEHEQDEEQEGEGDE